MTDLPSDEVMRALTKMALEQAFATVERMAREHAHAVPADMTGQQAMLAFARAIRTTTEKTISAGQRGEA